ncbi:MAG: VWD domain-containing protein [Candidatus Angelobacter sp.]
MILWLIEPASAKVNVVDVHSEYDDCVAKFRAAGLPGEVDQLDRSKHVFKIERNNYTNTTPDFFGNPASPPGSGGTTEWNPSSKEIWSDGVPDDACSTLYHEMRHLVDYDNGTLDQRECMYMVGGKLVNSGISISEVTATRAENDYRKTQHLPERTKYGAGHDLPPPGATCTPAPPPPSSGGCNVSAIECRTGQSNGDPHIVTFNGYAYPLQAAGEFVLSRSTDGLFEVQVRFSPVPKRDDLTLNTAIAIKFGKHRLTYYQQAKPDNDPHSLRLDGKPVAPTSGKIAALPGGGSILVSQSGSVVAVPTGERVSFNATSRGLFQFINISVSIPANRAGKYTGILGDGGGNSRTDLRTRNGKSVALANSYGDVAYQLGLFRGLPKADAAFHVFINRTFADSWRVRRAESLFDYAPGTSTETFTDRSYPRTDFAVPSGSIQGATQTCRNAGVAGNLMVGCIVDVSATHSAFFASTVALAQSLLKIRIDRPVEELRSLIPSVPGVQIPHVPKIPRIRLP